MSNFTFLIKEYIGLINQFIICFILIKQQLKFSISKFVVVSILFFAIEYISLIIFDEPILFLTSIFLGICISVYLNISKSSVFFNASIFILAVIIEALLELFMEHITLFNFFSMFQDVFIKIFIFIIVIIILIFNSILRKDYDMISKTYLNSFLCIGLFVALMICLIVGIYENELSNITCILLIMVAISVIISDVLICYFYIRSEKENVNARVIIEIKDELIELQHQRYIDMIESYSQIKKFRHDTKGYIATIQQFILNEDYSSLRKMIDGIDGLLKNTEIVSCNNPNIGAIVNYFNHIFKEQNLKFEFDYRVIAFIDMTSNDICSLFYNILENAREASMKSKNKMIKLIIKSKDKALIILLENSINKDDFYLETLKRKKTTKNDKSNHGIGLLNIDTVVNSYNGHIEYELKNDILCTTIILLDVIVK